MTAQTPFSLRDIALQIVDLCRPLALARGIRFELRIAPDLPPQVLGDSRRCRQALLHLLHATVLWNSGGTITLALDLLPPRGGRPPEALCSLQTPRIPSLKGDPTDPTDGVVLARGLVEEMGGCLWGEPAPQEGGTIFLTAPLAYAPPPIPEADPRPKGHLRMERLRASCHGEPDALRELLEEFLAFCARSREDLDGLRPIDTLGEVAHRMRGSFAYLMEGGVVDLAGALEEACLRQDAAAAGPLIPAVVQAIGALEDTLRREIADLVPPHPPLFRERISPGDSSEPH